MRYSLLGATGVKASVLGFGCMRLPMVGDQVDRERAIALLHRAVEQGVNFFDTAIGYCNGQSESVVGEALAPLRSRIILSSKNHLHSLPAQQWRGQLERSLQLLRTDYLDFYFHHGISWDIFQRYLDPARGGVTRQMVAAQREGLVRHVGFSFHDTSENLLRIIDTGYFDAMIVQYNLLDQANGEAMEYAQQRGMGVIVMGPVGGGRLGFENQAIVALTQGEAQSAPEAALRFVWGHPGVHVALSGMGDAAMVDQNVAWAASSTPFSLSQVAALNGLVEQRKRLSGLYCSGCGYCLAHCPRGIDIPALMELLNTALIFGLNDHAQRRYVKLKVTPDECIGCEACSRACPQSLSIPQRLREAGLAFDSRRGSCSAQAYVDKLDADGQLECVVVLSNFTDVPQNATAQLLSINERDSPGFERMVELPPFATRRVSLGGQVSIERGELDAKVQATIGAQVDYLTISQRFVMVPAGRPAIPVWYQGVPAELDFAAQHGCRVALWHEQGELKLDIEVDDDFLAPSRRRDGQGRQVDCVELFLDGAHERGQCGEVGGESDGVDGVQRFVLYPGTLGRHAPFYLSKGGGTLGLRASALARGYRLEVSIALRSVGVLQKQRSFGIAVAVSSADGSGALQGRYWMGGGEKGMWYRAWVQGVDDELLT